MSLVKRLLRSALNRLGYDVRKIPVGLDAINDIRRILKKRSPRIIFDVGAHVGETASLFATSFPQAEIHSFEPAPDTFELLQRRMVKFPRVRLVHSGLGSANQTSTLNVNKASTTNSFLRSVPLLDDPVAELTHNVHTTPATVRTLDSYAEELGIGFIDVLKMDVQGFELEVLRGSQRFLEQQRIALIYCEVSFETLYDAQPLFEDVYREVVSGGFRLVDLYGHARSDIHSLRWCDALFVHPRALATAGEHDPRSNRS
jgi:FkbM family methyltransferase